MPRTAKRPALPTKTDPLVSLDSARQVVRRMINEDVAHLNYLIAFYGRRIMDLVDSHNKLGETIVARTAAPIEVAIPDEIKVSLPPG